MEKSLDQRDCSGLPGGKGRPDCGDSGKGVKKAKRRQVILAVCLVLAVLAVYVLWELDRSKNGLCVSYYEVPSQKLTEPVRIVQLSDLHNSEFGEGNARLLEAVEAEKPDLILVTGDMVNMNSESNAVALSLLKELTKLAPVYVSMGNHELAYQQNFSIDLAALYAETGAAVLDFAWKDIDVKGERLRIGGIYGYCLPEIYLATGEARPEECDFMKEFQNTDRCSILLCHMPVCWIINGALDYWDADCVFAGHAHGGQVRLFGRIGLYAPDQGWFPGRLWGLYHSKDGGKTMVLSRGLGTMEAVPRFGNVPEIVVTDLVPET